MISAFLLAALALWQPTPGTTFQWQLTGKVNTKIDATVYDVDLFDTPASVVGELHAHGRKVVCYLSAGSWERWRPDARRFPKAVRGRPLAEWPGERWLDVRRLDLLAPILRARLDLCRAKGFDGVEPDNVDGYANPTGFSLTAADQLRFNRWLACEAHSRGLSIGLKNDHEQAQALVGDFDWALVEECFERDECAPFRVFVAAGKAVFAAEYRRTPRLCERARALGFTVLVKRRALDASRAACP